MLSTLIVFGIVLTITIKKNITEIYYHIPFIKKSVKLKREIVEKKHRRRHTRALNVIYIINIVVFIFFIVVQFLYHLKVIDGATYLTICSYASAPLFLAYTDNVWTFITYAFTHFSFMHFASNILGLYFISSLIRTQFKNKKILEIYLIGAVVSALVAGFFYSAIYISNIELYITMPRLIGASGSLFAFFGALYHKVPDYEYEFFFFKSKIKYVFWFLVITSIVSIISRYNVGGNFAHIGGAIAGYLIVGHYKKIKSLIKK